MMFLINFTFHLYLMDTLNFLSNDIIVRAINYIHEYHRQFRCSCWLRALKWLILSQILCKFEPFLGHSETEMGHPVCYVLALLKAVALFAPKRRRCKPTRIPCAWCVRSHRMTHPYTHCHIVRLLCTQVIRTRTTNRMRRPTASACG